MKILFQYLKPYKFLVACTLILAGINIGFSLVDPILFGKLVNLANKYKQAFESGKSISSNEYFNAWSWQHPGVWFIVLCSISVAMVSRIAKNFQDYFLMLMCYYYHYKQSYIYQHLDL